MTRRHFVSTSAALIAGASLAAEPRAFRSKQESVALLELYTSEGCSSCPPADEWFATLKTQKGLWTEFVPVAFHVDYWDHLGWKDPFAEPTHSQRQRVYAARWRSESIYTPGFVLKGQEWRKRDRKDLAASAERVGALSLTEQEKGRWQMRFEPLSGEQGTWHFHLALLGFGQVSKITRGENAGRTLEHDFVVLQHAHAAAGDPSAVISLEDKRAGAIAGWVSREGSQVPVQAVGGAL